MQVRKCAAAARADQVDLAVDMFRMLADATRVQLLWVLVGREMSVNDLAGDVGKPSTAWTTTTYAS
jgi:ArsR family transcriptional regulator